MPSQDVMMKLYMRIQGIENAKGFQLDEAMLDSVIGKYKVGSILNVPNGVAQSVEKWQEIIKRIQEKSMEVMGIPCVYGVDQIHGTTYTLGGTFFPQGVNMGATFNRELTREGARISAYETKAGRRKASAYLITSWRYASLPRHSTTSPLPAPVM